VPHDNKGEVVSYGKLFAAVKSGRNRENIRKHISSQSLISTMVSGWPMFKD
jgi:hypothetical protein